MPAQQPTDPVAENLAAHDDPTPMAFDSAESPDNEPAVAPKGYRPHYVATPAVMDDDLEDTEWMNAWRTYFASGSNHHHWFLIDHDGEAHMVEMVDMSGSYQAYGPGYSHRFENAYDAFWTAETLAKTFTDESSLDFQPRQRQPGSRRDTHQTDIRGRNSSNEVHKP